MSVIGVIRGAAFGVAVVSGRLVSGRAGDAVQADAAARVRVSSATADAVGQEGRLSIYRPFCPAGQARTRPNRNDAAYCGAGWLQRGAAVAPPAASICVT